MNTVLIVGLATLGVVVSLVLGLVALRNQRVRLVGSIVAIVLAATSALAALWGMGILFRATAPVPDDVLLFGNTSHSVFALKASDATTRWSFSLLNPNSVISSPRSCKMELSMQVPIQESMLWRPTMVTNSGTVPQRSSYRLGALGTA